MLLLLLVLQCILVPLLLLLIIIILLLFLPIHELLSRFAFVFDLQHYTKVAVKKGEVFGRGNGGPISDVNPLPEPIMVGRCRLARCTPCRKRPEL